MLTKEKLLHGLHTSTLCKKLFVFDTIDSTNACAKVLAEIDIDNGTVVIAEYQTEGRGRLGRSWNSEKGKNLLFSVIMKPQIHRSLVGLLPLYAALSVAQGIREMLNIEVECKWPNDILIHSKKCCGILLESSLKVETLKYAIIGIGINVNQERFDAHLAQKATSLKREIQRSVDRVALFQHIVQCLDRNYAYVHEGNFGIIVDQWLQHAPMIGKEITILHEHGSSTGIADGINAQGGLIVRCPDGVKTFYAGEVSIRYEKG